jgi:hypothetical protein
MHIDLQLKASARNMAFIAALPVEGPTSKWKKTAPTANAGQTVTLTHVGGVTLTFHADTLDSHHVIVDAITPLEFDPTLALLGDCMKEWVDRVTLKA